MKQPGHLPPPPEPFTIRQLPSGIIEVVYYGHQTYATVQNLFTQLTPYVRQLRTGHQPVLIVSDLRNVSQSAGARRAGFEGIRKLDFDRVATFGADRLVEYVANLVFRASRKYERMRYFANRQQALAWLKQHTPA